MRSQHSERSGIQIQKALLISSTLKVIKRDMSLMAGDTVMVEGLSLVGILWDLSECVTLVPAPGRRVHIVLIGFCPRGSGGGGSAAGEKGRSHLPSPISPTIQPTPVFSPVASHSTQPVVCPQLQWYNIAPIKGFVHEVLCRSRTSGTVFQTALCHLEAICSRVPDLVWKEEHASLSSSVALDVNDGRISQGEVGTDYDTDLDSPTFSTELLLLTVYLPLYASI